MPQSHSITLEMPKTGLRQLSQLVTFMTESARRTNNTIERPRGVDLRREEYLAQSGT